ncbi:phage portal protein, partial [Bacillus thuringiensis]
DYGDLFGRILNSQKRKNQVRGTVDMEMTGSKTEENLAKLQKFIDDMYQAFGNKDIAIVPQQKGINYNEIYNGVANGPSVEE